MGLLNLISWPFKRIFASHREHGTTQVRQPGEDLMIRMTRTRSRDSLVDLEYWLPSVSGEIWSRHTPMGTIAITNEEARYLASYEGREIMERLFCGSLCVSEAERMFWELAFNAKKKKIRWRGFEILVL